MDKEDDLPKSIIVILVVLAVAISILGTFTVVSEVNKLNSAPVYRGSNSQTAKVSLEVVNPNDTDQVTGKIVLSVLKKPEGN
ncbi:MAG: hypothetical protein ABIJ34_03580 [archaeon]